MVPLGKFAMTLEQIAEAENTTVGAMHVLIGRALKKLRRQGLILTARELAVELDRNRRESVE